MKIVLATKNQGKINELKSLLQDCNVELITLDDFPGLVMPEENGKTFKENAIIKARFVAKETGCAALADDSGLEVDSLCKRPGVFSARYAGPGASDEENYTKLLKELAAVPDEKKTARFRCAVALAFPPGMTNINDEDEDNEEKIFESKLEGIIGGEPVGEYGFGYDPVFVLPNRGSTLAEINLDEKNTISHRGQALAKLKTYLIERHCKKETPVID